MKSNPFPCIFRVFSLLTCVCGLGLAVIVNGSLFDVRGLIALGCVPMAVLHLVVARKEANR